MPPEGSPLEFQNVQRGVGWGGGGVPMGHRGQRLGAPLRRKGLLVDVSESVRRSLEAGELARAPLGHQGGLGSPGSELEGGSGVGARRRGAVSSRSPLACSRGRSCGSCSFSSAVCSSSSKSRWRPRCPHVSSGGGEHRDGFNVFGAGDGPCQLCHELRGRGARVHGRDGPNHCGLGQ